MLYRSMNQSIIDVRHSLVGKPKQDMPPPAEDISVPSADSLYMPEQKESEVDDETKVTEFAPPDNDTEMSVMCSNITIESELDEDKLSTIDIDISLSTKHSDDNVLDTISNEMMTLSINGDTPQVSVNAKPSPRRPTSSRIVNPVDGAIKGDTVTPPVSGFTLGIIDSTMSDPIHHVTMSSASINVAALSPCASTDNATVSTIKLKRKKSGKLKKFAGKKAFLWMLQRQA